MNKFLYLITLFTLLTGVCCTNKSAQNIGNVKNQQNQTAIQHLNEALYATNDIKTALNDTVKFCKKKSFNDDYYLINDPDENPKSAAIEKEQHINEKRGELIDEVFPIIFENISTVKTSVESYLDVAKDKTSKEYLKKFLSNDYQTIQDAADSYNKNYNTSNYEEYCGLSEKASFDFNKLFDSLIIAINAEGGTPPEGFSLENDNNENEDDNQYEDEDTEEGQYEDIEDFEEDDFETVIDN